MYKDCNSSQVGQLQSVQLRECLDLLYGVLMSRSLPLILITTSMPLLVLSEGVVVPPQLVPVPGRCRSPSQAASAMLGLDVGEVEAAAEQLLLLGQLEDGVGGEGGLEEGGLGGTDGDHTCSQQ